MEPFVYNALPARVIFGWDTISQAAAEVQRLNCSKVLVLTTPHQRETGIRLQNLLVRIVFLGDLAVGLYSNATMHTPLAITKEALTVAEKLGVDCAISVGGGSTIGLGKALALHSEGKIKQIAIPTTYAGSEATPILGQSETNAEGKSLKTTLRTNTVLPQVIIYDVDLTMTLSSQMTVTSGLNSIAHAVEALYAPEANPIHSSMAEQGISTIARSIPVIIKDPQDSHARADALFGAWCGGSVLGAVGMGLHHKLCHTLGGSFGMPHAETHSVILPHAVAYNAPYAKTATERIAAAMGVKNASIGLFYLAKDNGAPYSLKELGFKEEDLEKAAEIAATAPYPNPAPLVKEKILALLTNAFHGTPPK